MPRKKKEVAPEQNEASKKQEETGPLKIIYMPLGWVAQWDRNPKLHDIGAIAESIKKYGFRDAPIWDETLHGIVAGNGRIETLLWMKTQAPDKPPVGIVLKDGEWFVPIQFGIDSKTAQEAEAFAVDHNNIVLLGGNFTAEEISSLWDDGYVRLLTDLASQGQNFVSVSGDDIDSLLNARVTNEELPDADGSPIVRERLIMVAVGNKAYYAEATKEIEILLERNPVWRASIR